jgi:hypothetical protein
MPPQEHLEGQIGTVIAKTRQLLQELFVGEPADRPQADQGLKRTRAISRSSFHDAIASPSANRGSVPFHPS